MITMGVWRGIMPAAKSTWPLTPQPAGFGERFGSVKTGKLMDSGKDSLMGTSKAMHMSKSKKLIHCFPFLIHSMRAGPHHVWWWLGKTNAITPNVLSPFPSSSLHFIYWAWCHMVWNIPLISWGHLSHLCALPFSHEPLVPSQTSQYKKKKNQKKKGEQPVTLYQQRQKHVYVSSTVFITNPNPHTSHCEEN